MPIKPIGFSAKDLMEAGLKSQPVDPWHERDPDRWLWHASELSSCPRQLIYKRANRANDPRPLSGALTMLLGTVFHREVEKWVETLCILKPNMELVLKETGFVHPDIPLAAKPDAVFDIEGVGYVVMDFKTEHEDAAKRRATDARDAGRASHIRPEHALQIAAQAVCLEGNGIGPIAQGFALYVSKNSFWLGEPAQNSVDLGSDSDYRQEVIRRVNDLEESWDRYVRDLELPDRYDNKHWNCRPQTDSKFGLYCPARLACRG